MTKNLVRMIAVMGVVTASPALAQDVNALVRCLA